MKAYSQAPDECTERLKHLIKCFYPDLRNAGLKVDILSVTNDDPDAPALTHQGYAADAMIRVLDSKQRAKGSGDVEIIIDEARYITMTDPEKDALLDHEIHHVELRLTKKGRVKLDEHGRPKCGMKKHDYQFGWFREIAKRHGAASGEVQQAQRMFLAEQQVFFFFVETRPSAKQLVEHADRAIKRFQDSTPDGREGHDGTRRQNGDARRQNMNERLQLRWMIAMLEHQLRNQLGQQYPNLRLHERTEATLAELKAELSTIQRFHDEAIADGARQAQIDRDK